MKSLSFRIGRSCLEQVVESVGCLVVEFVIVFLQGAREQAGIGDWRWILGLAQVHYNPEGFGIGTYTFMECGVGSVHQEGAQSMTGLLWWTPDTTLASQGRMIDYPVMNYLPVSRSRSAWEADTPGTLMKGMWCPVKSWN